MAVLVAICCKPDQARYIDFYRTVFDLEIPERSKIEAFPGFFPHENKICAVKRALQNNFDYIFFVDDDQILPKDTLTKLLSHNKDIVVCNLLWRIPPFKPYIYDTAELDGRAHEDTFRGRTGLIEIAACGAGGLLVKTEVFRKLQFPWFAVNDLLKTDDLYFCNKAFQSGFKLYCDLDTPSGHIVVGAVWPKYDKGEWKTSISIMNQLEIELPSAKFDSNGKIEMKKKND